MKLIDPFCNCVDKGWHPIWKHRSILILLHFYGTKLFCTSLKQQNDFKMSMWCYLYPLVPKPPGSVIFSTRSNSSLQLQWATPDEMIGAPDIIYSITYQAVGGLSQNTTSTQNNTLLLSLLDSGTKYNVTVKATGPGNLSSTVVQNSFFTCKYNKKKLSVFNAWFYWPARTLHINQHIISFVQVAIKLYNSSSLCR